MPPTDVDGFNVWLDPHSLLQLIDAVLEVYIGLVAVALLERLLLQVIVTTYAVKFSFFGEREMIGLGALLANETCLVLAHAVQGQFNFSAIGGCDTTFCIRRSLQYAVIKLPRKGEVVARFVHLMFHFGDCFFDSALLRRRATFRLLLGAELDVYRVRFQLHGHIETTLRGQGQPICHFCITTSDSSSHVEPSLGFDGLTRAYVQDCSHLLRP